MDSFIYETLPERQECSLPTHKHFNCKGNTPDKTQQFCAMSLPIL